MEKLSEQMKSDLEFVKTSNMGHIPEIDIALYINRVIELEEENEQLKIKNEMLNDCNNKYFQENKQLKEKLNKYIQMACEFREACNCECHNCIIDEDEKILNEVKR